MAEVGGVPRERRPPILVLNQEVRRRRRLFRVAAPLGIVGMAGTGRKTLAHRFANMDWGVFEQDVPVAYQYAAFLEEDFPPQYLDHVILNQFSRFLIELTIYIIEEPLELPGHRIPFYRGDWNNFCCLVFVFDMKRPPTFCHAMIDYDRFCREGLPVTDNFMVGNKFDEQLLDEQGLLRNQYEGEAVSLGLNYFQCSAKKNIGVRPLLSEIKKLAIAERYWDQ